MKEWLVHVHGNLEIILSFVGQLVVFIMTHYLLHIDEMQDNKCMWMKSSRVWMRSSRVWMRSSRVWMRSSRPWLRSSRVCGRDLAQWLERLTANAIVATVLGSIPTSSDTVESEADEAVLNNVVVHKKVNACCTSYLVASSSRHPIVSPPVPKQILQILQAIDKKRLFNNIDDNATIKY
jgi:hypothetical protein